MNANGKEGKVARLISPLFEKSDDTYCLHFWFSASGPNIGKLQVFKAKVADISKRTKLWELVTDDDNQVSDGWTEGQVQYVVSN